MADKLKYSTTQPTLPGLRTDDFVLGTGDGNYGPTSTTSYLNGFTAPEGGYVVYTLGLSNTPIGWVAANDTELIDISRHLGNTDLTIKSAKVYLAGLTDTWIFNSTPNNTVTDGLVIEINTKNLTSYPDSETNWYDISGNGNDGDLYNGVARNNGSLIFDGIDDYYQANISTTDLDGDPTLTVEMTVKRTSGTNIGPSSGFWGIGGSGQGNSLIGWTPTQNLIHLDTYDSTRLATSPSQFYPEDQFINLVWVKDGPGTEVTNVKCYINGQEYSLSKTREETRPNQYNTSTSGVGVCLGRANGNSSDFQTPITVNSFKVYNRALSETEVKQNYFGGPIVTDGLIFNMDPSSLVSYENGSPQAFSLIGDYPTDVQNGLRWNSSYGGVFTPDGTDEGLATPHQPDLSLDANSLEGWVWFDQHKNYGSLLVKGPGGSGNIFNYSFFFYANSINYGCGDGGAWQNVGISTSQVPTGRFHHIVGTYDLNVLKFYLNGVLDQELEISFPPHQNADDLQVLQIPYNLDGKVGAARIYNRALTAEEVKQNFEAQRSRFGI